MASWSEKLNQVTQNAISKSKEVAGVAKLNMEINTLNQSVKNIYTEVGSYVLENGLLSEDASVAEWAAKAAALKADIEANTEKIMNLKNVSICPGCGAEVPKTSKFCSKCGSAIVVKASEPVEEEKEIIDADFSEAQEEVKAEEDVAESAQDAETEDVGTETTETAETTETVEEEV